MTDGFRSAVLQPGCLPLRATDLVGCPVHCRIFVSIPGLYPVGASSTSPSV